jgi:acetyl esterase/lipase
MKIVDCWDAMSPAERNRAFNNTMSVGPDFAKMKNAEWTAATAKLRERYPAHLDLSYGKGERNRWDLYPASDPDAPCLVYIHGGYWQRGSKEISGCLAEGVLARGWSAALMGYTLAPDASLTQIAAELRTALGWFGENAAAHGIKGPVILSGWSAGGHLAALLLDHPRVTAGLAISGVFDLMPLRDCSDVNDAVKLTETEIETLSPQRLPPADKPLSIAYGSNELPALIESSRDFHAHRAAAHCPGSLIPVAKTDHFTVLDGMRLSDSLLTRAILDLAAPAA